MILTLVLVLSMVALVAWIVARECASSVRLEVVQVGRLWQVKVHLPRFLGYRWVTESWGAGDYPTTFGTPNRAEAERVAADLRAREGLP